jgi:putative endonuclease
LEHIEGVGAIFTSKYKINKLVYFERYTEIKDAIQREKQLKGWRRDKKNSLVNSMNPEWNDLMRG